ncbi:Ribokinase-like protein [Apiosordaria backusii]|uniref:Ribokinase-like protein n=1 Tax=Apiosordaria backusii TaxID=314023 RepID=A0AA40ET57_9PEZI|nr:Ribokinase-like protein [Apiosordaria backusii]
MAPDLDLTESDAVTRPEKQQHGDDDTKPEPAESGEEVVETWNEIAPDQEMDFVTLGMFIIDEIHHPPSLSLAPSINIPGGAGTYSALGARLFSPPPHLSKTISMIIDCGSDFPPSLSSHLSSWDTSAIFRHTPSRLTTRGWNGYNNPSDPSHRSFGYLTPKRRLTAGDLSGLSPVLLTTKAIHLICSPLRCQELVNEFLAARKRYFRSVGKGEEYSRPVVIWEPVPDLCVPGELLNCTNTLPVVDICSPNHAELAGFMGSSGVTEDGGVDTIAVERACEQLLASMPLQSYTLVVRAGEKGAYIAKNGGRKRQGGGGQKRKKVVGHRGGLTAETDIEALFAGLMRDAEDEGVVAREEIEVDEGMEKWVPAYWTGEEGGERVRDPTGGGNTFLGGLGVALARGKGIEEAVGWGAVAASFAIEQVGMPVLEGEGEEERWNGERVQDRLGRFLERVGMGEMK